MLMVNFLLVRIMMGLIGIQVTFNQIHFNSFGI